LGNSDGDAGKAAVCEAAGRKMADPAVEPETDTGGCHGGDAQAEDGRDQSHEERASFEKGSKNRVEKFGSQEVVSGKGHSQDGSKLSESKSSPHAQMEGSEWRYRMFLHQISSSALISELKNDVNFLPGHFLPDVFIYPQSVNNLFITEIIESLQVT